MDVDYPVNLPDGISFELIELAKKNDMVLAIVLTELIRDDNAFKTIVELKMHDLRPLLALGKYNEVARGVLERISFSECIL
jgi:hypothetical protein